MNFAYRQCDVLQDDFRGSSSLNHGKNYIKTATLNNFKGENNKYIMDIIYYILQSLRAKISEDSWKSYNGFFDYPLLEY